MFARQLLIHSMHQTLNTLSTQLTWAVNTIHKRFYTIMVNELERHKSGTLQSMCSLWIVFVGYSQFAVLTICLNRSNVNGLSPRLGPKWAIWMEAVCITQSGLWVTQRSADCIEMCVSIRVAPYLWARFALVYRRHMQMVAVNGQHTHVKHGKHTFN